MNPRARFVRSYTRPRARRPRAAPARRRAAGAPAGSRAIGDACDGMHPVVPPLGPARRPSRRPPPTPRGPGPRRKREISANKASPFALRLKL